MSFDLLAPHYRWMERVLAGGKLQRCRTEFLSRIAPPKHALLVGEGNGRFLSEFVRQFPQTQATCLDASAKMLEEAKRAHASNTNIRFVHADIFTWDPPLGAFDLIVTNFFLDCFGPEQLAQVVPKLASAASPDAIWLLSDFCEPPAGWRKWRARWILQSMYLFFRFVTKLPARRLTPPDPFLNAIGFRLIERSCHDWGLLHSDYWSRAELE
jgi:ubiquinone/menaquinone biosynthesis C-methylase UbiE